VTATPSRRGQTAKSSAAFRTISEVSQELDVPQHVLRFWETKFSQVRPLKRGGGRRYYRPEDIDLLRRIRDLLYAEGYTIKGAQKILRDSGVRYVMDCWKDATPPTVISRTDAPQQPKPKPRVPTATMGPEPDEEARAGGIDEAALDTLRSVLEDLADCRRMLEKSD